MKRLIVMLFVAVMLAGGVGQAADVEIDLGAGYSLPTGHFQDNTVQGMNIGGNAIWYPFESLTGLGFGGQMRINRFDMTHPTMGKGNYYSMVEVLPAVRYNIMGRRQAYDVFLQAAYGVYLWSYEEEEVRHTAQDDVLYTVDHPGNSSGFSLGLGLTYQLSKGTHLVVFPHYNWVNTGDRTTTFYTVNVGIGF